MSAQRTTCTIGDVLELQRGYDITRSHQRDGDVPVVSSGGISSFHDESMSSGPGVVIGRKGTLGKVFYLPGPYWPHDTTLWVRDFKGSHPRFVYYFFQTLDFGFLDVGSANPTLNRNHVHPLPVSWPAREQQRAIAEVLGVLDDKIAANHHAAGLVEELLRATFDDLGIMDEVGGDAPLSELVEFQPRRVATGEVPFIDMQAIPTRGWTLPAPAQREAKGGARFANGDTLLARITPCLENRKTGYVDDLPDAVGVGSTEFIVMRTRRPHPLPLSFFLATDETFRAYAIQHMVGTSGRQRVGAADLAMCPIHLPSPEALREWGQLAEPLFAQVRSMGRENRTLAALRDALLPELMSGRLRVKDAEKSVEEVV